MARKKKNKVLNNQKRANAGNGNRPQKISSAQKKARLEAAQQQQQKLEEKQRRRDMVKKIGIIAVCVVLVIGLAIPTVALTLLGGR